MAEVSPVLLVALPFNGFGFGPGACSLVVLALSLVLMECSDMFLVGYAVYLVLSGVSVRGEGARLQ